MRIEGTTAIVTGAASGLGLATAKLLATAGAKVAGLDIAFGDAGTGNDGIRRLIDVHLVGTFNVIRLFAGVRMP